MRATLQTALSVLLTVLALPGCDEPTGGTPVPRGERLLGVAVTEARGEDFGDALTVATDAGMEVTNLALAWDDLETAPGRFDPDPNFLAVADAFYPDVGLRVALELNPVDTNNDRRPPDLRGLPFDHPDVLARFSALLTWAAAEAPDLGVVSLTLGNEVDALLGDDAEAWAAYGRFFTETSRRARSLWPGVGVGVKATFDGLVGPSRDRLAALNASADVVMATYYPLGADFAPRPPGTVGPDFDRLAALYPDRPISILEAGYPSGSECGGSEAAQAAFVREAFAAWDRHADQVRLVSFTWLTDLAPETVSALAAYYGVGGRCFEDFLGTLGLREHGGRAKPALRALAEESEQRGW